MILNLTSFYHVVKNHDFLSHCVTSQSYCFRNLVTFPCFLEFFQLVASKSFHLNFLQIVIKRYGVNFDLMAQKILNTEKRKP